MCKLIIYKCTTSKKMAKPPVDPKRRLKVMFLYVNGMNTTEIAQSLGLSKRTIDKDLAERRSELASSEQKEDMWQKIGQLTENQRQRVKRLWTIVTDNNASRKEVMRALDLLQKEDDLFIKRGQMAGMLPKDTPFIAIQNNTLQVEKPRIVQAYEEHLKSQNRK